MYGDKITWLQRFMLFFQPSPIQTVKAELKAAEHAALQSQSMAEYAALRVKIHDLTTEYHNDRVERLSMFVKNVDRSSIEEVPERISAIEFKIDRHDKTYAFQD